MDARRDGEARIRPAAVAGRFYPLDAAVLADTVRRHLGARPPGDLGAVRAIVAPHAGYPCSGAVAGAAFAALAGLPAIRRTVYLLGPAHWLPVYGVGLSRAGGFRTPLGLVAVDRAASDALLALGAPYRAADDAHAREHCLEVQLPFLQLVLPDPAIVPMLLDDGAAPRRVAADLAARLANDADALLVVSSDLSHYHPQAVAAARDRPLLDAVVRGDRAAAATGEACGLIGLLVLMDLAEELGWRAHLLAYASSGETCGPPDEVVGYGAIACTA